METLQTLPAFDCHNDIANLGVRWLRWKRAFQFYLLAKDITDPARQKALLLHTAGMDVQDIYDTLSAPPDVLETDSVFDKALKTLDHYFKPKLNTIYERHLFRQLCQEPEETMDHFVVRLRRQSDKCSFGENADEQIRDHILDKCSSATLRRKFLEKGQDLTLAVVQEMARNFEAVTLQCRQMNDSKVAHGSQVVCSVKSKTGKQKNSEKSLSGNVVKENFSEDACYRCGHKGHRSRDSTCPARGKACRICGSVGHFASCCKTKRPGSKSQGKKPQVRAVSATSEEVDFVFSLLNDTKLERTLVDVGGVELHCLVDSGSTVNVIDKATWELMKEQKVKCKPEKIEKHLYAYGQKTPLRTLGCFTTLIKFGTQETQATFWVITAKGIPILSRSTAEQLKLLRVGPEQVHLVQDSRVLPQNKAEIIKCFPACFEGLGKLKDYKVKIHIDTMITPVAQKPRRIPFSLREKLEQKLDELLKLDIIERVEGPTPWVSPVVIVPKPSGDIRLCVDMRQANQAVIRERHMIPTVEEILYDLNGSSVFSKLDLCQGFHQLVLDERSRYITCFQTHVGLFRYIRLNFGISSAPELFQYVIQQVLADCDGAKNIADDIIVFGNNMDEHDKRLKKVLLKLQECGLTLNASKCEFRLPELQFMGHVLSKQGIRPTQERVEAILETRKPQNVKEVRSLLGLVNFCARFIPDLATVAEPLRKLIRQEQCFTWGKQQEDAFNEIKSLMMRAENLAYFDKNAKTEIQVDASPYGLGAMLIQVQNGVQRVISYASRSLSSVERRYAQTEREALGIVWACERFHMYIYGVHFELVTDHKPLLFIYTPKSKPSARIERWILRLQIYDFSLRHISGNDMAADALSRLRKGQCKEENTDEVEGYINGLIGVLVPHAIRLKDIEKASNSDKELCKVKQCIQSGRWTSDLSDYTHVKNELTVVGDIILRGVRIVVPKELRQRILKLAHEGHQGIVKTKQRLRTKVWWPGIDRQAEKLCQSCFGCQTVAPDSRPEPVKMTILPDKPWEDLAADVLGPMPNGEYLLVTIDYFSRYFEVDILSSITSASIIDSLDRLFTIFGYPLTLKTDNAKSFTSVEFNKYMEEHGITLRHSTPLWPESNGQIERQNRSLLKAMRIAQAEGLNWKTELRKFLIAYRTTPHTTTAVSPGELLFGRKLRSKLPDITLDYKEEEEEDHYTELRNRDFKMKQKQKDYADQVRHTENSFLNVGDYVLMRQPEQNKLSTKFDKTPFRVIDKQGSHVTVRSPSGVQYTRNSSFLKKLIDVTNSETVTENQNQMGNAKSIDSTKISKEDSITDGDKDLIEAEKEIQIDSKEEDKNTELVHEESSKDILSDGSYLRPVRSRCLPKRLLDYDIT